MLGGGHINADMQQFLDNDKKAKFIIGECGRVYRSKTALRVKSYRGLENSKYILL